MSIDAVIIALQSDIDFYQILYLSDANVMAVVDEPRPRQWTGFGGFADLL